MFNGFFLLFLSLQQDVEKFTDIEKLYLYLKLPSGPSSGNDKRYITDTRCTLVLLSAGSLSLFLSHTPAALLWLSLHYWHCCLIACQKCVSLAAWDFADTVKAKKRSLKRKKVRFSVFFCFCYFPAGLCPLVSFFSSMQYCHFFFGLFD